jgi:hypothetical protein
VAVINKYDPLSKRLVVSSMAEDGTVYLKGGNGQLPRQPSLIAITIADNTKTAGPADRRGKSPIRNHNHRREQNRALDF